MEENRCEKCCMPGKVELKSKDGSHSGVWLCDRHTPKQKIDNPAKDWIYMTLSPSKIKRGSLPVDRVDDLCDWAESWFNVWNYKHFFYALEMGSDKSSPHPHIHALVKGPNKRLKKRGHYTLIKDEWNRVLPCKLVTSASWMEKQANPKLDVDILYQHINSQDLWNLKYNYLNQDLKGTHRNYTESINGSGP